MKKKSAPWRLSLPLLLGLAAVFLPLRADPGSSSLVYFDIENCPQVDNPWAGVDSTTGDLQIPLGSQLAVNDSGNLVRDSFSPSIAVGDLNGDGLPDLVVADGRGYIWYFPNVGTKTKAAFSHGEIMPIWFGSQGLLDAHVGRDVVPRIQLIDYNNDGKLDLVIGTFDGRLYLLPNSGTPTQPLFQQPPNLDRIEIPTRSEGALWCNYLAPTLYSWNGRGVLDLIMGEGTYSANSIYLLRNQSGQFPPLFNENRTLRMIRGNGREHLTPRVVDWNGDGKPDIISGEREGYIDLFLNNSTDPDNPTFAEGTHVQIGGEEKFGQFTTVEIADLNGNHLPNIIYSNNSGQVFYATNTGSPGNPQFPDPPIPLQGINPYPKIYQPAAWRLSSPYGNSYELLVATCANVENGFQPPPDHQGKFAMRAYVFDPQTRWFTGRYDYDPNQESFSNEHGITFDTQIPIQAGKRYELKFTVKASDKITNARVLFLGHQRLPTGRDQEIRVERPIDTSSNWNNATESFTIDSVTQEKNPTIPMILTFRWHGLGSFYLDDISLQKTE